MNGVGRSRTDRGAAFRIKPRVHASDSPRFNFTTSTGAWTKARRAAVHFVRGTIHANRMEGVQAIFGCARDGASHPHLYCAFRSVALEYKVFTIFHDLFGWFALAYDPPDHAVVVFGIGDTHDPFREVGGDHHWFLDGSRRCVDPRVVFCEDVHPLLFVLKLVPVEGNGWFVRTSSTACSRWASCDRLARLLLFGSDAS